MLKRLHHFCNATNWAPEPDRHTNAASINTEKWEPPPIRDPRLFLTPYIYMSIYLNRFNYPSLSLRNKKSLLFYYRLQ